MEKGPTTLLIILGVALLLGALIIGFNPSYRQAFVAILNGTPAESPIWKSNIEYYPDVSLPLSASTELPVPAELEPRHDAK
jgi:hypothetical protein